MEAIDTINSILGQSLFLIITGNFDTQLENRILQNRMRLLLYW